MPRPSSVFKFSSNKVNLSIGYIENLTMHPEYSNTLTRVSWSHFSIDSFLFFLFPDRLAFSFSFYLLAAENSVLALSSNDRK